VGGQHVGGFVADTSYNFDGSGVKANPGNHFNLTRSNSTTKRNIAKIG